jgi:hypothetical protein
LGLFHRRGSPDAQKAKLVGPASLAALASPIAKISEILGRKKDKNQADFFWVVHVDASGENALT